MRSESHAVHGGKKPHRLPIGGRDLTRLAIGIIGIGTSGPLIALGAMAVPVAIFWRNLGGSLITLPFALAKGEWRTLSKNRGGGQYSQEYFSLFILFASSTPCD